MEWSLLAAAGSRHISLRSKIHSLVTFFGSDVEFWKLFFRLSEKRGMTEPRKFLPNTTYFITRRCTQRQFLLKPTKRNTQIFLYCLAVAAKETGVNIHAVSVMSNHYHILATDPQTRISEFYGWVHKYVAKAVNASYGRFENLWSSEKTSVLVPESGKDVLGRAVYTLSNPVAACLVAKGEKWPVIVISANFKTSKPT